MTPKATGRPLNLSRRGLLAGLMISCAAPAFAKSDLGAIGALRYAGLQGSQVMNHLSWLADVYGPRATGTPGLDQASEWTMARMRAWGLTGITREYFPFGEGWVTDRVQIRMTAPQSMQIVGYPVGWTPGTDGEVEGEVVDLTSEPDLTAWTGKLRGKIVLVQSLRKVDPVSLPLNQRYGAADLEALEHETPIPWQWLNGELRSGGQKLSERPRWLGLYGSNESESANRQADRLIAFLKAEGALAVLERGAETVVRSAGGLEMIPQQTQRVDGGTVFTPASGPGLDNRTRLLPWLTIAVEQYNRLSRILALGEPVRVALDVGVTWYPEGTRPNGFNTLGEIAGTDGDGEVVILGAHLDGAPTASGAVDNAAGVAIVLEAARLIKAVGIKPRRTIRVALWGGEENGLLGSRAYVDAHYGDARKGPPYGRAADKVAAYFNIDSGAGRVRGLFARHNLEAIPVLREWIAPLADLGVTAIAPRATPSALAGSRVFSGSDHISFDVVGIPSFELIQDRLDYFSRTAHSNMDYADRAPREDMIQAAVALAVIAYQAASSDAPLPRRPAPSALGAPLR